ncbi:MAG: IclR family transcriptional regulator [Anaerolineales bacterium]
MKPPASHSRDRYNIEALARGLDVLSLFSVERPALSFSQIVKMVQLNKSTVYRVLSTLEAQGYLEQDAATRLYRPGLRVLQLGFTAVNSLEVRQIARPHLEKLSQALGETVSLAVLDGFRTVYVDRVRNQSIVGVTLGVGSSLPAHCSSLGQVLLADLPAAKLDALLAAHELTAFTPKTLTSVPALRARLEEIRQRGYAVGDEELAPGLRAVSAAVRNGCGQAVAAVNVTGSTERLPYPRLEQEIVPALLETVGRISTALGYIFS